MRKVLLLFFLLLTAFRVTGQDLINLRKMTVYLPADSVQLDSLSIVPESIRFFSSQGMELPDSLFRIDPARALIYPSQWINTRYDSVSVQFRVFPFSWTSPVSHKNKSFGRIDPLTDSPYRLYKPSVRDDLFGGSELVSNGNISRGLTAGNTRDPSFSSDLNLQLSGKINKDFSIEANLSDANIPLQPEGNTQQIQDFDRFYIRVFNPGNEILGGDFELQSPSGYFMKMNKKVQGARVTTRVFESPEKKTELTTSLSGAVVKGKYTYNAIPGQEGNQGPYRLTGQSGETYIQVIAGSEKVFIDGVQLTRGEQNDYVIDYNTAEIRFTPKNLITKDKRIRIEFEYTEQSYARFLLSSNTDWKREKSNWYVHFFSEHDARNQPLLQDLSDNQKSLLSRIGDQAGQAVVPNYYPANYVNDRVLYKLTDTLVDGIRYDSVLVYSINPDSARYQAGFSFVGSNKGDYVPVNTSANGQVYKWVARAGGIPQGSYAPLTRLIAPRKKKVFIAGGQQQLSSRMGFSVEMAVTGNDLNSFSDQDDSDNTGFGFTSRINRTDPLTADSGWVLSSEIEYRRSGRYFDPLERFRPVEFERDWNLDEEIMGGSENMLKTSLHLKGQDIMQARYQLEYLTLTGPYSALRHLAGGDLANKGLSVIWSGSIMNSRYSSYETGFTRHNLMLAKELGQVQIFARENHEGNLWVLPESDSAREGSFKFQEWKFGLENSARGKIPWHIHFTSRTDYLPLKGLMSMDAKALQLESGMEYLGKKGSRTALSFNWRDLESNNEELSAGITGRTVTSRIEENFQLVRGAIVSRSFYEIGSGLEREMEYSYLEVAPGQGHYTWTDYNHNGNKELDEFETAYFRDQADYIRIFRPGLSYIPTYINRFNQILNINPGRFWKNTGKAAQLFSRFNNSLAYRVDRKNYRTSLAGQLNPFSNRLDDSLMVSNTSLFRNTLSFNKSKSVFGIDYHFENSRSQILMSYGTDKKYNTGHRIVARIHPMDQFWITNISEKGEKEYISSFFSGKNYLIGYLRNQLDLTFKPGKSWQTGLGYEWRIEDGKGLPESVVAHRLETSLVFQMPSKGQIQLEVNYLSISFEGDADTPAAYVLLQGFRPGNNGMLSLMVRRKLNDLIQLDFRYEGRVSEGSRIVHTGNVQLRAVF